MNNKKLRAAMVLQGVSMARLATLLEISKSALYRKMNGKSQFTQSEMLKAITGLSLDKPADIFFDTKVS